MRLERLRQLLDDKDLDALLVAQADNRYYLSGFTGSAGVLVIGRERAILATDFRYVEQAGAEAKGFDIRKIDSRFGQLLPQLIVELGARRVGFEAHAVTYSEFQAWGEVAKDWELVPVERPVEGLRTVKDAQEVEKIAQAARLTDAAFEHILGFIRPGLSEKEVAWELERYLRTHGADGAAFDIIVASGPHGALPHAHPTERKIAAGEPIVLDLGARFDHYCSDLTRTICLGQPDETLRSLYALVLRAQTRALEGIRSGMRAQEADALARRVIEEAGHGPAFGHSLGHGVGLAVHEGPLLSWNSEEILAPGMVATVEPGVYMPGWGGVRIEDLVLVEEGGIRVLSQAPKDAFVCR